MTTPTAEGDLIMIPVPRKHLMAVYGFLAQLDRGDQTEEDSVEDDAEEDVPFVWSVEDLRRFAETPTATSDTIGKVLDVLAAVPGEYLPTSDLEEKTGVPRNKLKGAFSALTRHINTHYDGQGWMLMWEWGSALGAGHLAETHYMLNDEQAARWKEARATA
jgi:hypothetical protein